MKTKLRLALVALTMLLPLASVSAVAEVAIVVSPDSPIASLTREDVEKIFLGKTKKFPDGSSAMPLDLGEGNAVREEFYSKVINKTASQLNSYWSRLIFTGKGQPPRSVEDADELLDEVGDEVEAVGYVDASLVDDRVKVVLTIP